MPPHPSGRRRQCLLRMKKTRPRDSVDGFEDSCLSETVRYVVVSVPVVSSGAMLRKNAEISDVAKLCEVVCKPLNSVVRTLGSHPLN